MALNIGPWLWYWLQFPGSPTSGRDDDADVILVQAFGRNRRNTLIDIDLPNLCQYRDQHTEAATLAWCRDHIEPGRPNRALAMQLISKMHQTGCPAIVQWEVAVACPADWYERHRSRLAIVWPSKDSKSSLPTREVLRASLAIAVIRGWSYTQPLVLAHAGHVMRVAMILRRLTGRWPIVGAELPDDFDRESVQSWTKNRAVWMGYEFLARVHHVLHRWV